MAETPQPKTPDSAGQPEPAAQGDLAQALPLSDDQVALAKNGQRYVFTCPPGSEPEVLNQIAALVTDPTNDLTWFDAAVLSHQLGERMSRRLHKITGRRKSA